MVNKNFKKSNLVLHSFKCFSSILKKDFLFFFNNVDCVPLYKGVSSLDSPFKKSSELIFFFNKGSSSVLSCTLFEKLLIILRFQNIVKGLPVIRLTKRKGLSEFSALKDSFFVKKKFLVFKRNKKNIYL